MKIVHTSDWHIGKRLNERDFLSDQREVLLRWIDEVVALAPDLVIIAGDLYDRSLPSQEAVALVNELFVKMSQAFSWPVVVISGNHDNGNRVDYGGYFLAQANLHVAGKPQVHPEKISLATADVYLLPFAYPATIRELYQDETIKTVVDATERQVAAIQATWDPERLNIIVYHGSVSARWGESAGSDLKQAADHHLMSVGTVEFVPVSVFAGFDYVALGHIHGAQRVGSAPCYYSGSPMKYSKNEAKQKKQYLEITLDKTHCDVVSHPIAPVHELRTVQGAFADLLRQTPSDDYLYFELTDQTPQPEAMSRLRQVYPNAMSLQYVASEHPAIHQLTQHAPETLRTRPLGIEERYREFYQQVMDKPLSEAQTAILTATVQQLQQEGMVNDASH